MEQVGGRHLSPVQQRRGCTPAVVGGMSQKLASQKGMCDLPAPKHPWNVQKGPAVPMIWWRLLLSILYCRPESPGGMCITQTLHLGQKALFVPPPHSPLKFPEVCNYPRTMFPDKTYSALVFSRMWLILFCFVLFFISLNLGDHFHSTPGWCIKASHNSHTCSHSLSTCCFFLSASWIQIWISSHATLISASPSFFMSATLLSPLASTFSFGLCQCWPLTQFSVVLTPLVWYLGLAENLHTKHQSCRIRPATCTWVVCMVQTRVLGKQNYLTETMAR